MTDPLPLLYSASLLAVGTGWTLAARAPEHRPVAAVLTLGLAGDLLAHVLQPAGGWVHPLGGAARAAFHASQALLSAYPLAVLACAAVVLLQVRAGRAAMVYGAGWGGYCAALVAAYRPLELWDQHLERVYGAVQAFMVAGVVVVAWRWARARRCALRSPSASEVVALWLGGVEVINLAGPYLLGFSHWPMMARAAYALSYVVVACIQGVEAWRRWA